MKLTNVGAVINFVAQYAESTSYKDFIAFQDEDGAIVHIRTSEVTKLYNFILQQQQRNSLSQTDTTQQDLDNYFIG